MLTAVEGDLRARHQATEGRQVGGDDGRHLGVPAGGLAVGEEHDRQAVARHLDGTGAIPSETMLKPLACSSLGPWSRMPMRSVAGDTV
jgi:hypothetical protein